MQLKSEPCRNGIKFDPNELNKHAKERTKKLPRILLFYCYCRFSSVLSLSGFFCKHIGKFCNVVFYLTHFYEFLARSFFCCLWRCKCNVRKNKARISDMKQQHTFGAFNVSKGEANKRHKIVGKFFFVYSSKMLWNRKKICCHELLSRHKRGENKQKILQTSYNLTTGFSL